MLLDFVLSSLEKIFDGGLIIGREFGDVLDCSVVFDEQLEKVLEEDLETI